MWQQPKTKTLPNPSISDSSGSLWGAWWCWVLTPREGCYSTLCVITLQSQVLYLHGIHTVCCQCIPYNKDCVGDLAQEEQWFSKLSPLQLLGKSSGSIVSNQTWTPVSSSQVMLNTSPNTLYWKLIPEALDLILTLSTLLLSNSTFCRYKTFLWREQ